MNGAYRNKHAAISTEEYVVDRAKVIVDEKRVVTDVSDSVEVDVHCKYRYVESTSAAERKVYIQVANVHSF